MNAVAGLDAASRGSAYIGDTNLSQLSGRELTALRRDRLGFILQSFNLVPTLTAAETISLPTNIAGEGRCRMVRGGNSAPRAHRAAQASPHGALRWAATARGVCPGSRGAAGVDVG